MLLKSHDLKSVITQVGNLRQDIQTEFLEGADFLLFSRHSYMALVDERMRPLARSLVLPLVRLLRIPHLGTELLGLRILDRTGQISRKSLRSSALPLDEELVKGTVAEEHIVENDLPVAAAYRLQGIGLGAAPVVEVPYQIYLSRIGSPLTEHPVAGRILMKAVIHMVVHALAEGAVNRHSLLQVKDHLVSSVYDILVWLQPLVIVIDHLLFSSAHILCSLSIIHSMPQVSPAPL